MQVTQEIQTLLCLSVCSWIILKIVRLVYTFIEEGLGTDMFY